MTICNQEEDTYFDKVLQSALHHPRRAKRMEMVYILGEFQDDRALAALKTIMSDDDPCLVCKAVEAAGKIGGLDAIQQLEIMAHHPSFIVRGEVDLALQNMDHPRRQGLLSQLLNDTSPYVANCANLILNCRNIKLKGKYRQKKRFCYAKRCNQIR
jgi:HEAT repeat protein